MERQSVRDSPIWPSEESVYSGEILPDNIENILGDARLVERIHTPFVAEMVNQIVFVPDEFFTEERKAIQEAAKTLADFQRHYSISAHVGPGDPIEEVLRSVQELLVTSQSTSTIVDAQNRQAAFAEQHAPQLWNRVLLGRGRSA